MLFPLHLSKWTPSSTDDRCLPSTSISNLCCHSLSSLSSSTLVWRNQVFTFNNQIFPALSSCLGLSLSPAICYATPASSIEMLNYTITILVINSSLQFCSSPSRMYSKMRIFIPSTFLYYSFVLSLSFLCQIIGEMHFNKCIWHQQLCLTVACAVMPLSVKRG